MTTPPESKGDPMSSEPRSSDLICEVIIAGGGPVGLLLAGELARRDVRTVLVEASPTQRPDAMGMAINALVVELLTERDLMTTLEEDGVGLPFAHFAHLWVDPGRLTEPHPANFVIPQRRLEEVLQDWAVKLGAQVLRGCSLEHAQQDDAGVRVRVKTDTGEQQWRAAFLVGCDGAGSTVRELAGIDFPGTERPFHGVIGDIAVEDDDPLHDAYGARTYPTGLFTVSPSAPGVLRVTAGRFGVWPTDRDAPVGLEEFRDCVQQVTGQDLRSGEPRWLARWFDVNRHADRYRQDRILIAGDAAHVHFPVSGHGLGTGLEDAVNLGWKLAAQVQGWAPGGLLYTYQTERHPVGARACEQTAAQVALMHPLGTVRPLRNVITELIAIDAVNDYFVRAAGGFDVRYQFGLDGSPVQQDPLLGRRLPHYPLATNAGTTDVGVLLRSGRGLLLDLSPVGPAFDPAPWAGRLDVVRAESGPGTGLDARALLLRPDGRVVWVQRDASADLDVEAAAQAVLRWLGEPLRAQG